MSNTEGEKRAPSRRIKHICVPFASEAHYQDCVDDVTKYRQQSEHDVRPTPRTVSAGVGAGLLVPRSLSLRKPGVTLRRIKLKATGAVFTLRPSFLLPYGIGRTEEVEKALFLRQWGVPFEALAYVFGRNAMFWYRAWLSFGPSQSGRDDRQAYAGQMPQDVVADEKITWLGGAEVVVPTTVGGGCVLGISVAAQATSAELQTAYGEFKSRSARPSSRPINSARSVPMAFTRPATPGASSFRR